MFDYEIPTDPYELEDALEAERRQRIRERFRLTWDLDLK